MSDKQENSGGNFVHLINQLLAEKDYNGIVILLQDKDNCKFFQSIYLDIIEICKKFLSDNCYENNKALYSCCEILLRAIADYGHQEEVLFELFEIVETTNSDNLFISVLKASQICLFYQKQNQKRSLEWTFDCIRNYILNLPISKLLKSDFDKKSIQFHKGNDEVYRILKNYNAVILFSEPILIDIIEKKVSTTFLDTGFTERNMMFCFYLQLLNKPLALLNISDLKSSNNKYSMAFYCAKKIVTNMCILFPDPFYLMGYIEKRIKIKPKYTEDDITYETRNNIFFIEEKFSYVSLGIYFYLLFNEGLLPSKSPKVYHPLYIFESCLYLSVKLLKCDESILQNRAILLITEVLNRMKHHSITSNSLNLRVHPEFCNNLIKVIVYSNNENNRICGIKLLKLYILKFDDDGRYFLLKNLMRIITHDNLLGYIFVIYKDIIAEKLENNSIDLNKYYKGNEFKNIMLNFICSLGNDIETNLMHCSDKIISSLNIIRYFAIRDNQNKTGFWDFSDEIKTIFLKPLREIIDLSRAQYKIEEFKVSNDECTYEEFEELFRTLSTEIPNLTKERKLSLLGNALTTFDLIESLLIRVSECIDSNSNKLS